MDKVQNTFSSFKSETLDLVDQIKGGKIPNEKQVRFINLIVFGKKPPSCCFLIFLAKLSLILLVFPSIYRYFVIGAPSDIELERTTLEFLR